MTFLRNSVSAYYWLVFLGLVVVGLVVQAGIWNHRYPVQLHVEAKPTVFSLTADALSRPQRMGYHPLAAGLIQPVKESINMAKTCQKFVIKLA